jgi:hypothetical protein
MLGLLENLTKAVIGVAVSPVDAVADVITLGGVLSDQEKPYTVQRAEQIMRNLNKATE